MALALEVTHDDASSLRSFISLMECYRISVSWHTGVGLPGLCVPIRLTDLETFLLAEADPSTHEGLDHTFRLKPLKNI